jgi:nucleoside-diphosphate-sugar epimerase
MHTNSWQGRRVLVTGASGFIGSHTVAELVKQGAHVAATTRSLPFESAQVSIKVDSGMEFGISEFNPECVIHLATKFLPSHTDKDIGALIESNIEFGTRVLQVSTELGALFLTASSHWQHYQGEDYSPVSLYAATKQAFITVAEYYKLAGLDFRELTLFDSYGINDSRQKLVSILLQAAQSGEAIEMGDGTQLIDLLYVSDSVAALLTLADMETGSNSTYVARSHFPLTVRELVSKVESATGHEIKAQWGAREPRPREMVRDWQFGTNLPAWEPHISLEEGIARCWAEVTASG